MLASRLPESLCRKFLGMLAPILTSTAVDERFVTLSDVTDHRSFVAFGFTDATVEAIGNAGVPVFTDDSALSKYLSERGIETFNYNHVRVWAS